MYTVELERLKYYFILCIFIIAVTNFDKFGLFTVGISYKIDF